MKKLLLISVLAMMCFSSCICVKEVKPEDTSLLRWNRGDVNFGGKLAYGSESQGDIKESELKVKPSLGFLVSDNFEVGGEIGFSSGKNESGSFEDKWSSLSVGPYFRYYYCDEYRLIPYLEGGVNYISNDFDNGSLDYKQSGFNINAGLGVNYFINERFALTAGYTFAEYQSLSDDRDGVENLNSFNAKLNTNRFSIGGRFRF